MKRRLITFRREEKVKAIRFSGDWQALADGLGWSMDALIDRWPKVRMEFDKRGERVMVFDDGPRNHPYPAQSGDWVLVDGDAIVGIASEGYFDSWGRL